MSVSFSGLTSGLNTDQIIQQLLQIERRPIKRFESRIDQNETTQGAFKDLNNRISNLFSELDALASPDTFNQKQVTSSNTDVLSASIVDADKVNPGTFDVFVESLASTATTRSGQIINNQKMFASDRSATSKSDFELVEGSGSLDLDATGSEFLGQLSKEVETSGDASAEFTISQGGTTLNVDLDGQDANNIQSFQDLIDTVNNTFGNLKLEYNDTEDKLVFVPTDSNGSGGTSFTLDTQEGNISDSSRAFLRQVGITTSDQSHTFDETQTDFGQNLVSVDPSAQLDQNLFTSALSGSSGSININGTTIQWDLGDDSKPDTINELVTEINEQVEGVNASYNGATDKITLSTENTGAGSIDVFDESGNLADVLNLRTDGSETGGQAGGDQTDGSDAEVKIDGDTVTADGNTVTFNGIELNLKSLHKDDGSNDPVKVEVGRDTEAITEDVQAFVDQFNSVIDFINTKSQTDPASEPGEERGDAGPFASDFSVRQIKRKLTSIVTDRFKSVTGSDSIQDAGSVGIELFDPLTASDQDRGKLKFDSAEFKSALDSDQGAVEDLFTADTDDGDPGDGIATRLREYTDSVTNDLLPSRIDAFDTKIQDLQDRIDRQEERVQAKKEVLESQFLRMEQMLATLQNQQQFLSARL